MQKWFLKSHKWEFDEACMLNSNCDLIFGFIYMQTRDSLATVRKAGPSITSYFVKKQPASTSTSSTLAISTEGDSNVCVAGDAGSSSLSSPPAKRKRLEESVDETQNVGEEQRRKRQDSVTAK